jgi:hypothetical protein
MIDFIKDIELNDHVAEYDAIIVGTNTCYAMRHGFQRIVMLNYPYVYEENLKTKYGDKNKMGEIIECKSKGNPTFILCFINNGINTRPDLKTDFLSYDSLENALKIINVLYKGKHLACTLLGNSKFDGNGDKDRIVDIFKKCATNVNITIYDYVQKSRDEMIKETRAKELEIKKTDIKKYYDVVAKRKEKEKRLKSLNGHAKN